jgi:hypothetical protein
LRLREDGARYDPVRQSPVEEVSSEVEESKRKAMAATGGKKETK